MGWALEAMTVRSEGRGRRSLKWIAIGEEKRAGFLVDHEILRMSAAAPRFR
jgi:hypothetical protein